MVEISPELRDQLTGLSEAEWSALTAQVRAPDTSEQLRTIAGKTITDPSALDAFVAATDVSKFAGDGGQIDEQKVTGHINALFGAPPAPASNWGQYSDRGPGSPPGTDGKAAAAKRFRTPMPEGGGGVTGRGAAGRAAAQKRFGPAQGGAQ